MVAVLGVFLVTVFSNGVPFGLSCGGVCVCVGVCLPVCLCVRACLRTESSSNPRVAVGLEGFKVAASSMAMLSSWFSTELEHEHHSKRLSKSRNRSVWSS